MNPVDEANRDPEGAGENGSTPPDVTETGGEGTDGSLEELRTLLLGEEIQAIKKLQARLDDRVSRATELAQVLPEAIAVGAEKDDRLGKALQPTVDASLKEAVRRDPRAVADAIFPTLGPAIRKAVSAAILAMIQSLSHVLDQSLSIRGIRWRIEAWRTGVPYAEVVLLNTLVFRVEQVLFIHRETGLLLENVTSPDVETRDSDMVSGMLSAIQNFMEDSFGDEGGGQLDVIRIGGDKSLWIEDGSDAILAAEIRGTPPMELRQRMAETLTDFETSHGSLLSDFSGDTSPFAMLKPRLEDLLESRFSVPESRVSPLTWAVTALLILFPLAWGVHAFLRHRELDSFLSLLRDQDGIVVSEVTRAGGQYLITGLRDPGAADLDSLRVVAGLEEEAVSFSFQPFHALAPALVVARARDVLEPPQGIDLRLDAGILKVTGTAPLAWIRTMRERSPSLVGVDAVDESGLESPGWDRLLEIVRDLERVELLAPLGSAELSPGQGADVDRIAGWIRELQGLQGELGVVAQVVITGFADPSGTEEYNIVLSRARADRVQSLLVARGVSPGSLVAVGGGVSYLDPAGQATQRDRRITFRVVQAL